MKINDALDKAAKMRAVHDARGAASRRALENRFRLVLGERLRLAREGVGASQREVGEFLNVTQGAWSKVESGRSGLSLEDFCSAAMLCERDPAELLAEVLEHNTVRALGGPPPDPWREGLGA